MATDRDEQQRQQQELDEIRRSFAEMGARMGSLFEPAETDEHHGGAPPPVLPPAPPVEAAASQLAAGGRRGGAAAGRHRLRLGALPGRLRTPRPRWAATGTTAVQPTPTAKTVTKTVVSVPEQCVETAELADEVISRLNRNVRDERLFLALRDYTIASQACRREASP